MPTFSIIVPVYNAEKTLHRCLDTLAAQTYGDFEVLMIENGSKDSSNAICREYAETDPRFLLHSCEKPCGPSAARNMGLDHALGTYITFLDSDDYVELEYLEVLVRAFENADVVFLGYYQRSIAGTLLGTHIPDIQENSGYYETLLQLFRQDMFGYTWIKAFRRDVISTTRFSSALNLLEDEVFACEVLSEPRRIAVVQQTLYNYITGNPGSLIGRTHPDYCQKVDTAYKAWKKLLDSYEKKEEVLTQMANAHVNRCMYYGFEHDVDAKEFFSDLAESDFFAFYAVESEFAKCVKSRNYRKLVRMRVFYIIKNKIAKLLKKRGK